MDTFLHLNVALVTSIIPLHPHNISAESTLKLLLVKSLRSLLPVTGQEPLLLLELLYWPRLKLSSSQLRDSTTLRVDKQPAMLLAAASVVLTYLGTEITLDTLPLRRSTLAVTWDKLELNLQVEALRLQLKLKCTALRLLASLLATLRRHR